MLILARLHNHLAVLGRRLDGIQAQIETYLYQLVTVPQHGRQPDTSLLHKVTRPL
jgi:hypothetical protein